MSLSAPVIATVNPGPDVMAIEDRLRLDIAARRLKLPVLPNVAAEVLSSTLDDGADAKRLANLIQKDQSLATHVLRVVNSPLFRGTAEIVALQQAIARLGMVRIREIALTASLKNALPAKGAFQVLMDEAWRLGLATGLWAREFARATRKNVELSYLGGLLHNVGSSVIAVEISNRAPNLSLGDAKYLMAALGPESGATLVDSWKLPAVVGNCIQFVGGFANSPENQDEVATVEAGRAVAVAMRQESIDPEQIVELEAVQHLNLYPEDVEELLAKVEQISNALESMIL
jgi:HD-like signal output (HDOD) protein